MRRWRRLVAAILCLAISAGAVGVPLPARAVKNAEQRFPCENCPCGCADAESCWRNCCCHTNREKLAWAKRNGVTPPSFVAAAAEREPYCSSKTSTACCKSSHAASGIADASANCTRCAARACIACATGEDSDAAGKSCSGDLKPCAKGRDAEFCAAPRIVLLASALKCRGISLSVSMLPPFLIPKAAAHAEPLHVVYATPIAAAILYQPPSLDLPTPPPDITSAS